MRWLVGRGEWLVTRVGGVGGGPGPGMTGAGNDANDSNAVSACVAGSGGKAGGGGGVRDASADRGRRWWFDRLSMNGGARMRRLEMREI